jgi:hypothetical protein
VEANYLGGSSLALLAWKYAPQRSEVIDKFRIIDDKNELYRGSIGGLEQDGLLVGIAEEDSTRTGKETLISLSIAKSRLIQELGAESVLTACKCLSNAICRPSAKLTDQCTKLAATESFPYFPSYPSPKASSPTKRPMITSPSTLPSTATPPHHFRTSSA